MKIGFLKYLFDSIGNLVLTLLAMLFLGAGILPLGSTDIDAIAVPRAV